MLRINGTGRAALDQERCGHDTIEPGTFRVLRHNGQVRIAGPGRWRKWNPRADWGEVLSLTDLASKALKADTLTIVRVPGGFFGLARDNGRAILLGEGYHAYNDRNFVFSELVSITQEQFTTAPFHILRIARGFYARIMGGQCCQNFCCPGTTSALTSFYKS